MKCQSDGNWSSLHPPYLLTRRIYKMLKEFSMAQQELAVALQEAQPLGICKITISGDPVMEKGVVLAKDGTFHVEGSKETSL